MKAKSLQDTGKSFFCNNYYRVIITEDQTNCELPDLIMITILIIATLIIAVYIYSTRNFNYWKSRGVKHDKPIPLFGNNMKGFFFKKNLCQTATEQYRKYPEERLVGFYRAGQLELIIRDPEIAKRILITDFSYFHRRQSDYINFSAEPLSKNLFNAHGDQWRMLRQRLTPAFTSGKLKAMFPLIVERAERLDSRIRAIAGAPIDARELMARFTTDFIGACGFGLDIDALSDDDSKFRKLGKKIFAVTFPAAMKTMLKMLFPTVFKRLILTKALQVEIFSLVDMVLKQRNHQPSGRNDFIDLLLECQKKGTIVGESIENFKPDGTPEQATLEMTDAILAAQVFVFFAAGFETSSSVTSYTLHLLAYHPEIQKKVQENIDRNLLKHDNKLCYDAIKEMDYLEWTLNESMRIFPSLGFLIRSCSRPYKFQDMDFTIDKGVNIIIPIEAMQNDPLYFKDPEEFQPERFNPKNLDAEKIKNIYLPFGDGPRACVGERLGRMQSMAGLAAVLSKYSVEPAPTSVRYPVVDTKPTFVQVISAGLPLYFRERKKLQ